MALSVNIPTRTFRQTVKAGDDFHYGFWNESLKVKAVGPEGVELAGGLVLGYGKPLIKRGSRFDTSFKAEKGPAPDTAVIEVRMPIYK